MTEIELTKTQKRAVQLMEAIKAKDEEKIGAVVVDLVVNLLDNVERQANALERVAEQLARQTDLLKPIYTVTGDGKETNFDITKAEG